MKLNVKLHSRVWSYKYSFGKIMFADTTDGLFGNYAILATFDIRKFPASLSVYYNSKGSSDLIDNGDKVDLFERLSIEIMEGA